MSREGMKAARAHGELLPSFPSLEAAEQALREMRDDLTQVLLGATVSTTAFSPDFSPECLKGLERWYEMYMGEVLVRLRAFIGSLRSTHSKRDSPDSRLTGAVENGYG